MKLRILGTGCPKCEALASAAVAAADALGLTYQCEKITDINAILAFGVMMTPALVIDDTVVVVGRVPTDVELKSLLTAAASA